MSLCVQDGENRAEKKKGKLWTVLFWCVFNPIIALIIAAAIIIIPLRDTYDRANSPSIYDNVFVAELGHKYDRLCAITEPKIAVVGGSSVAFGLDSELLSRYTGMEVVNFGLYATLGSKVMLDLSLNQMNPGDVVIFAPEPDAQTMSLFFGADSVWQAIDVKRELYDVIAVENKEALLASFDKYLERKEEYDEKPDPSGVYNVKSFDEYGDICYPRPYTTMAMGYDPNTLFGFEREIVSTDFIDYFNDYCSILNERGVSVYFSFCPINDLALKEGVDSQQLRDYQRYLDEILLCPIISDIEDYIMDWGYFFDTNMHLNDAGVVARTNMLINDVRQALGMNKITTLVTPDAPGREGDNQVADGNNAFLDYFTYEESRLPDGTLIGLKIVGVTELAASNTEHEITLPYTRDGVPIIDIGEEILCNIPGITTVYFGENVRSIANGALRGCDTVTDIYLYFGPEDCSVSIPNQVDNPGGFLNGAREDIVIHVKDELIEDFQQDYTWGHYYIYIDTSNINKP